ncbi:indolepyruvate ferredoxin oxidoreductase subunit alpha [Pusillimonas noertemannii]|uniref:Indolepyruvate ferredoxin oxidoreductase alpha subunit n=1 Tax=Pusillimonas noertemannii TaxID=305977 RepID=A0A2U1CNQ4_9BURK|nr:indolepyruvate ferredoxin oxidoreductase subunit alpha [Pusillimonas noertemannii]NYT68340.1 indolepyruvate ferredoxin oxidoreductase subunit alpha [Pusillimonas noertemannii]PVY62645.1 indolepyruvate ferredoxin oxidoreductase alpha subunit [Pusillimonas noertemannii]TFL10413.1 indolepyruvate ferredoxin oxidoreductase subunit alpha [Pusillimonas noertemannii]
MAERSFKKEVQQLRIAPGEEFRGEGILAVTKGLLQSGVSYVAGYQGAPISHLMDVLSDAQDILEDLGVHFEASASEATAAATLAASVMYPVRGAVTWKSTVGTNVASDALANLASGGVKGGALVIVGEDYGEGSSIMQERTHAFAMKSQIWLLDPRPNLESMVDAVEHGFQLSEASNTPVILQLRIRSCHVHGRFITKENKRPEYTLAQALDNPERDVSRIVLPPASFLHEHEKVNSRWPAAVEFIKQNKLNEFIDGDLSDIGLILQGGLYNGVIRALQLLGLADHFGNSRIPLYIMNVTYPVIDDEVAEFCRGKKAVLMLEEGQPNYIEQNIATILRQKGVDAALEGKGVLPIAGEYTTAVMRDGLQAFLEKHHPESLPVIDAPAPEPLAPSAAATATATATATMPAIEEDGDLAIEEDHPANGHAAHANGAPTVIPRVQPMQVDQVARKPSVQPINFQRQVSELAQVVPPRPAGFCTGCPERPVFSALSLAQEKLGEHHIACDIGCHLFSILPPFNLGATTMGYGLGASSAAAFNVPSSKRSISIMGDGGFWHNGLASGIGNAVFNKYDGVIIIIDNFYAAATGGQDILSSRAANKSRSTNNPIVDAVKGVGVKWVRVLDRTYSVSKVQAAIEEALTTPEKGPKVIIAQSECMLNKQRRLKPQFRAAVKEGKRVVKERFGVDPDVCTGDHACIRLSGCPSLTIKDSGDPLKEDPIAHVDNTCVGCGNCGEVAHAAVLCPSFYRADLIHNPTQWDLFKAKVRQRVIGLLQSRRSQRLNQYSF